MLTLTKRHVNEGANMHDIEKLFSINKMFTGSYKRIMMESPDDSGITIDIMVPTYTEELTHTYKYETFEYDIKTEPDQTINITSFQVRGEIKVLAIWLKLNGVLSGLALPPVDEDSEIYIIRVPSLYVNMQDVSSTKFQLVVYCEPNDDGSIAPEPEISLFHGGEPCRESKIPTNFIQLMFQSNFEFYFNEMFMSEDFPITYHYPNGKPDAKEYKIEDELFMDI